MFVHSLLHEVDDTRAQYLKEQTGFRKLSKSRTCSDYGAQHTCRRSCLRFQAPYT